MRKLVVALLMVNLCWNLNLFAANVLHLVLYIDLSLIHFESLFCDDGNDARVLEVNLGFSLVLNSPDVSLSLPNDVFHL